MSAGALLEEALAAEAEGYRRLLAGEEAGEPLCRARDAYLASHAETGPRSWGRLVGALKMAVLAGDGAEAIARRATAEAARAEGPSAAYADALAAVILGAEPDVEAMLEAGGAFGRTGRALRALAAGDAGGYRAAIDEILEDFAGREAHLSGVAIADTALVLERLAEPRGMAARPGGPLLPVY